MSETRYFIQFMGLVSAPRYTGFCLGAASRDLDARIILRPLAADYLWTLNQATGVIALAAQPNLVLSFAGHRPENETPLVLALLADSENQQWNWYAYEPRIVATRFPTFAIDLHQCETEIIENKPLWMYNTAYDCQAWRLIPVDC